MNVFSRSLRGLLERLVAVDADLYGWAQSQWKKFFAKALAQKNKKLFLCKHKGQHTVPHRNGVTGGT
jgi:hypothetical protein